MSEGITYFIAAVVMILIFIFGGIVFAVVDYKLDETRCNERYSSFERTTSFWAHCQIKTSEGKWIPSSNLREFAND